MKKKAVKIAVFLGVVVITITVCVIMAQKNKVRAMEAEQEIPVQTEELQKRSISNSISVTGTIASAESKSVSVELSQIEVSEVGMKVGDVVSEGDVLVRFDSSDIEDNLKTARESLSVTSSKSELELESAQENLENAQVTRDLEAERADTSVASAWSDYCTKGADQEAAEIALQNASNNKKDAESAVSNTQNALSGAQSAVNTALSQFNSKLESIKALGADSSQAIGGADIGSDLSQINADTFADPDEASAFLSALEEAKGLQSTYQSQKTAYESAQSAYSNAQKAYQSAETEYSTKENSYKQSQTATKTAADAYTKAVQSREDSTRNSETSITTQQNNITTAELNAKTAGSQEESQIKDYLAQIEDCTVTAPIGGVVTSVGVEEGKSYSGGEICVIQDYENFIVKATVDQYDISDIELGMKAVVKTDTTEDLEMEGTVSFISPVPEAGSGSGSSDITYAIEITLADPSERLRIGMTAKTSIVLEEKADVFAVPYDCIATTEDGSSSVTVLDDSGQQHRITVEAGLETDYYTEITGDDLKEGLKIVLPVTVTSGNPSQPTGGAMIAMPSGGGMPGGGRNGF